MGRSANDLRWGGRVESRQALDAARARLRKHIEALLAPSQPDADEWDDPAVEIRSGAIIWDSRKGLFRVEANTAKGLRRITGVDDDEPAGPRGRYSLPGTGAVCLPDRVSRQVLVMARHPLPPAEETPGEDETPDPAGLVADLRAAGPDDAVKRRTVLDAEVTEFPTPLIPDLLAGLRAYIERNRFSGDSETAVAVCSAVRKYVAELSVGRLDEAAGILAPGAADVPVRLEAEVAKMAVRKFTAAPPDTTTAYPVLTERLTELAEAYLHPRHLRREFVRATAMYATLALAFVRGEGWAGVLGRLDGLRIGWLRQQLGRQAASILVEFRVRGLAVAPDTSAALERLVSAGQA